MILKLKQSLLRFRARKDFSLQYSSASIAFVSTFLFWLLLLILLAVIKPALPKKQFKEVQIVLSSQKKEKKQTTEPVPVEMAASGSSSEKMDLTQSETAQAAQQAVQPEAPKTQQNETASKPKPAASKPEPAPVQTYKSVEEQMAEQFANKKQSATVDWDSLFADDAPSSNTSTESTVVQSNNSLSGQAASVQSDQQKLTSQSERPANQQNQKASSSTNNALNNIANSLYNGKAANGVQSQTSVQAAVSGNGNVQVQMSNGSVRALLNPSSPVINLSEAASATIDVSKTVTITFRVVESGNVPRGEVKITPESILTSIVRAEIADQISRWVFEAADYSAIAKIEYKIIKQ